MRDAPENRPRVILVSCDPVFLSTNLHLVTGYGLFCGLWWSLLALAGGIWFVTGEKPV